MYYTWLMLALAAMTGNATVRGGGIGSLSPNEGMSVKLGKAPGMAHGKTFKPLLFSTHVSSQVIMTGRDTRTPEQLREDIKLLNGIDLGEDPRLHLEMFIKGAGSGDVFNQRAAINPKLEAWNKLTSVITFDRFMSTTGRYSDIIFPVVTHFEESFITGSRVKTDTNFVNQILDPMYECKTDWQINELIAQRLGINWGRLAAGCLPASSVRSCPLSWERCKPPPCSIGFCRAGCQRGLRDRYLPPGCRHRSGYP